MRVCPTPEEFERFVACQLAAPDQEALEAHVESCPSCQQLLDRLTAVAVPMDWCRGDTRPEPESEPRLEFLRYLEESMSEVGLAAHGPPGDLLSSEEGFASAPSTGGPAQRSAWHRERAPGGRDLPAVAGYDILSEVGRGGMGIVYKARHLRLNRVVALKMVLAGDHAGPRERERFRREAEAAAALEHPHIVQIYEIGEEHGRQYLALEFVDGGSLARKLGGTPQPARRAAEMVEILARAMHAAHQRGIIHRDLKPANVLLTANGTPKISDFGLAKRLNRVSGPVGAAVECPTHSGQILGTPSYMAPEQASRARPRSKDGRATSPVSPATDVYSLGAILYEILTGRPPFKGETDLDTVLQVVGTEPVPPSRLQPKVPRDLETICFKCLHKDPVKRYGSSSELADDLRRFQLGEPILAKPVGTWERALKWARRRPAVVALSSGLALLALVSFFLVSWQWFRAEQALRKEEERALAEAAAKSQAEEQKDKAEKGQQLAQHLSADLILDRGLRLCDEGDVAAGLLWLAWSLETAPPTAYDLHYVGRLNLAVWSRQLHVLKEHLCHPDTVNSLALNPEGSVLVTSSRDNHIRFWEMKTGRLLDQSLPYRSRVCCVAFDPSGTTLFTGSDDKTVREWDLATGKQVGGALRHSGRVVALSVGANGRTAGTLCADGTGHIWNTRTGKRIGSPLKHPEGHIRAIALSADGKTVATAGEDKTVRLWETDKGKPARAPLLHLNDVRAIALSRDGKRILTGSGDSTARLFDAITGKTLAGPLQHHAPVAAVAFSPDGTMLVTAGGDSTARVWSAETGQRIGAVLRHGAEVKDAIFTPDGRSIATLSREAVRIWDIAGSPQVADSKAKALPLARAVRAVALSPCGTKILIANTDKTVQIWETATRQPLGPPLVHSAPIWAAAFHPDGQSFATCAGPIARHWQVGTAEPLGAPLRHGSAITALAYHPDGTTLVTGTQDGAVQQWDVRTSQPIGVPVHCSSHIRALAVGPDGKTFLTGSNDGRAQQWDAVTGQPRRPPMLHHGWVHAVAFSPDGRIVLTGSRDGTAQRWEAATGKPLGAPIVHTHEVGVVAFSPDGKLFLIGGNDGMARLWHTATGRPLGCAVSHQGWVRGAVFHADGQHFLTGSLDGTARAWDLPCPLAGDREHLLLWAQVVTGLELDNEGVIRVLSTEDWRERNRRLQESGSPGGPDK